MLTYSGEILASDKKEKQAKVMPLTAAHPKTNEALFHQLDIPRFLLFLQQSSKLKQWLNEKRLQRHVGVFYNPQEEIKSHYSYTHLADQFDAVLYIDSTHALNLLE
jgi:erythromycin esterase-like protein